MNIEFTLPWPPQVLNPNKRVHWAKRAKAAKAYRAECGWQVRSSITIGKLADLTIPEGKLHLWIEFYPPDRRARDDDNMLSSFKSGRDGVADALGVNDNRFICRHKVMDQIGGMVKVIIKSA